MLDNFMKQKLKLIRKNGQVIEDVHASVQEVIYINDVKLPVEEGDIFEYKLPSGFKQRVLVTKVTLYSMNSPLDHYEIEYVKE